MRLLLLLVLCACTTGLVAGESGPTPTTGPEYAVLRLDEAIRASKLYLGRLESLKREKTEAEEQLKQMETQLKALGEKLEVLSQTGDKYAQALEEREVLKTRHELLAKRTRALLERRHGAVLKETYEVLRGHLAAFAKERRIRLISLAPNPELPNAGSNEVLMQLGMQTALYYDPAIDITDAFVAFANGRHASEAPATPTGP